MTEEKDLSVSQSMYTLMVRQLLDDGHTKLGLALAKVVGVNADLQLENHLLRSIVRGYVDLHGSIIKAEEDMDVEEDDDEGKNLFQQRLDAKKELVEDWPEYKSKYVTQHKGACTCAAFSRDGKLVATSSIDASIKVLDVAKMHYHKELHANSSSSTSSAALSSGSAAVVRNFYDHADIVNEMDFHPTRGFLASASEDRTIKLFDLTKEHAKRAYKRIMETHPVRSLHHHPQGSFLLAGVAHPMIRVYDIETLTAYVSQDFTNTHEDIVSSVRYAPTARLYASGSKDGTIKLWDTVTNKCIRTINKAHSGKEVTSVSFSSCGNFILSGGRDSSVRLHDVFSGKQVMQYEGARQQETSLRTCFDYSGHYVLSPDETTNEVMTWNAWTGELVQKMKPHNQMTRYLVASPTEPSFVTCSDSYRAKFWSA